MSNNTDNTTKLECAYAQSLPSSINAALPQTSPVKINHVTEWFMHVKAKFLFLALFLRDSAEHYLAYNDEQSEFLEALLNRALLLSTPINPKDEHIVVCKKFDLYFKSNKFWNQIDISIINYININGKRACDRLITSGFMYPLPMDMKICLTYIFGFPNLMERYGNFFLDEEEDFGTTYSHILSDYANLELDDSNSDIDSESISIDQPQDEAFSMITEPAGHNYIELQHNNTSSNEPSLIIETEEPEIIIKSHSRDEEIKNPFYLNNIIQFPTIDDSEIIRRIYGSNSRGKRSKIPNHRTTPELRLLPIEVKKDVLNEGIIYPLLPTPITFRRTSKVERRRMLKPPDGCKT